MSGHLAKFLSNSVGIIRYAASTKNNFARGHMITQKYSLHNTADGLQNIKNVIKRIEEENELSKHFASKCKIDNIDGTTKIVTIKKQLESGSVKVIFDWNQFNNEQRSERTNFIRKAKSDLTAMDKLFLRSWKDSAFKTFLVDLTYDNKDIIRFNCGIIDNKVVLFSFANIAHGGERTSSLDAKTPTVLYEEMTNLLESVGVNEELVGWLKEWGTYKQPKMEPMSDSDLSFMAKLSNFFTPESKTNQ